MNDSFAVVWLDLLHAKLFRFSEDRMERQVFHATRVDHHTHRLDDDERDPASMFDQVAATISQERRILILGPGIAKTHFLSRLRERFPQIAARVVACENSDHPTDHQIAAYAVRYFRKPVA